LALGLGEDRFSWVLQKLKTAGVTRVIQCIRDRPGLFSKMVGVFTLNNIKVLSVNVFTLKNGLAFDVYEVTNPLDPYREIERWKKIHEEIGVALEDRLHLDERIQEKVRTELPDKGRWKVPDKKVMVNNEASDFFTVIEVSSGEQPGLLYHLAKKLFSLGLDIRFARVHTDKERMTGVFYVSDPGGQKVQAEEQIRGIKEGILSLMS
jgi:[protein-PII] uridylyltransferase